MLRSLEEGMREPGSPCCEILPHIPLFQFRFSVYTPTPTPSDQTLKQTAAQDLKQSIAHAPPKKLLPVLEMIRPKRRSNRLR